MVLQLGKEHMYFEYEPYSASAVVWITVKISKWINSNSITFLSSLKSLHLASDQDRYFDKFKERRSVHENEHFFLVQIVLLSKYWSDAAKPRGWIHSIWGGGRREELPQATVTYKTMMSKIGMYWYFQLGCWYKKEEFWAKSFEPIKFSLPLAGLLIRPTAEADEGCRGQSSSSGRSADIICSVRDKASQWSWWEGCARPERLVVSS